MNKQHDTYCMDLFNSKIHKHTEGCTHNALFEFTLLLQPVKTSHFKCIFHESCKGLLQTIKCEALKEEAE